MYVFPIVLGMKYKIKKRNDRPLVLVHSLLRLRITAVTCLAYQRPGLDRGFEF